MSLALSIKVRDLGGPGWSRALSIKVRAWGAGPANRSEGLGWLGPVDKSEGFRLAGLAQGPSIKVRGWGGRAGLGPVDKSEGLGAGLARALSIKVRGWGPGRAGPGRPKTL